MRKEMKDEEGRYVCTVNSLMELSDGPMFTLDVAHYILLHVFQIMHL